VMTGDVPDREDLVVINFRQAQYLLKLENASEEDFSLEREKLKWVFISGRDKKLVELIPNGKIIPVTWDRRKEYVSKVIQMQLKEDLPQMEAIKRGFGTIIPAEYLGMFSWQELESVICGEPELDISQLKASTIYEGVSPSAPHIQYFWQAMEELTPEQHEKFLQFAWARPRMPLSGKNRSLTIQGPPPTSQENPNMWLPTSRTCFFSISLPEYTTYDITKAKLLWALKHCKEMNADFG